MPQLLKVESFESEKPIILVYGEGPLVNSLIAKFVAFLKTLYISDKQKRDNDIYYVPSTAARSLLRLKEKISYAVFYLSEEKGEKIFDEIADKLSKDETKISIIIPKELILKFYKTINKLKGLKNVNFEILGETFGNETPNTNSSKIIGNAIIKGSVFLSDDDALPIYFISFDDALNSIYFYLFGETKREKISFLFYENPSTYISLIHALRKIFPDLEIDFKKNIKPDTKEKTHQKFRREVEERTFIKTGYAKLVEGFDKEVKRFSESLNKLKIKRVKPTELFKEGSDFSFKKAVYILIFTFLFIFISSGLSLIAGGLFLKQALNNIGRFDFASSKRDSNFAKTLISLGAPSVVVIDYPAGVFFGTKPLDEKYNTLKKASDLLYLVNQIVPAILDIDRGIEESDLQNLIGKINYIYDEAEQIKIRTGNSLLKKYINEDSSKLLSVLGTLPEFLGFDRAKNYLLIFQNSGELRPTGGFIGSVGELNLLKGKIENLNIRDVYELDGQLKAHVEPHYIVRRYLQPHMYLRDSNFDPDFSSSASYSALLYYFESEKKVDGVVGIDFEVLKRIIQVIGPIKIKEYNQKIDEKNVFAFLQNTIEEEFFPGSTEKRDILNSLFNQIALALENNKKKLLKVTSLIPRLLTEKHILLYSANKTTEQIFLANGFAGAISDFRNKDKYGIYDFLSINEANIGVNKANINVTRKVEYSTKLSKNKNESKVVLTLENSGDKIYKSYIRILTPRGSSFNHIRINGKTLATTPAVIDYGVYESASFIAPKVLELEETTSGDVKAFGFITNVPIKSTQTIELFYNNGDTPLSSTYANYSLLFIKQPGTLDYPLTVKVDPPKEFRIKNNGVLFDKNIDRDKEFKTTLIKK